MATNVNIPIPQNPIGENYPWRDWFQKLSNKVYGSLASQNSNGVTITGGTIDNTAIGSTTPSTGNFTSLKLSSPLKIAYGGTNGFAVPTAGAVAYGNGGAYAFTAVGTTGQVLTSNGGSTPTWTTVVNKIVAGTNITISPTGGTGTVTINASTGTTGTVTSVGLALPSSVFNVTNSPVTTTGTLTGTLTTQAVNSIFAGPSSGVGSFPTFRALVTADIPALPYAPYPGSGIPNSTGTAWGSSYGTSGANSVVLRDTNQNVYANNFIPNVTTTTSSSTPINLTIASAQYQIVNGTTTSQQFNLPDATTLTVGDTFYFNNNITYSSVQINAHDGTTSILALQAGGAAHVILLTNSTTNGTWDVHSYIPSSVSWGNATLNFNSASSISGSVAWQGNVIGATYGGTGVAGTITGYVYANGTGAHTASTTIPTTALSGTITNAQLANSAITINGTPISLGGSVTTPSGTVTSVGMTVPSILSVTPSTITTSGSFALSLTTESANQIFAGPSSGAAATPTFRSLTSADIPALPYGTGTVTSVGLSLPSIFNVTGSPVTNSGTLSATLATETANYVFAGPTSGAASAPSFRALVSTDIPALSYQSVAAPTTVTTATYSISTTDLWVINNYAGSLTLTLPTASSYSGRVLNIQNYQAFTVVSASSNVVQIDGSATNTSILLASSGDRCTLVSNGTNWVMTQYTPNNILLQG